MKPMRADIGYLLERIEPAAPKGDSHLTAGKPAAKTDHAEEATAHGEGH
jgi:NADH-quinone oxidoreductase subunit M